MSLFRGWKKGFALYSVQEQRSLTQEQLALMKVIAQHIVQNGYVDRQDIFNGLGSNYVIGLVQTFGKDYVDSELAKLAGFVQRDYTSSKVA